MSQSKIARNRRYKFTASDQGKAYFQLSNIKLRYPLLYEECLGRFEQCEDVQTCQGFVDQILSDLDTQQYQESVNEARRVEQETFQEFDDDDDEVGRDVDEVESMSLLDRQTLLIRQAQELFMAGKDVGFDYSSVDLAAEYDDTEMLNQDEQDLYFQEESSSDNGQEYTGEQDY